ncbi:MAG: 16S rRNA processing protein RimM [Deltaproteobacteria bacterium]|nr:16S rRNA processing protein RimM [Deltaproteobacteria bacterium]
MRGAFFLRCDPSIARDLRRGLTLEFAAGETRRLARIRECSTVAEGLRVCMEGIEDRDAAAALTGAAVLASRADLSRLKDGEFFDADLLGLEVVSTDGRNLGTITEIVETGANDVYVVTSEAGEILVPAVAHAVASIDLGAKQVTVIADALEYPEAPRSPSQNRIR